MSLGRMLMRQLSPVTDQVLLTGVAGVSDTTMLLDAQVTHVLNLARELSDLTYPETLTEVRRVSLRDAEDENLLPHLDELADYVHDVTESGGRIVVHCVAGVSRSASVCIAYLMKHRDMTLREAHQRVKEAREVINPNSGFWAALIEYEWELKGSNSVELMPFVAGSVPSIDSYKKEMMYRMRLGWMDYVFYNIAVQLLLLVVQMFSVCFFVYDV
ncbi:dual specificity protein phosphatase 18 [Aplysia californica]|uniref:Dual specificity protein phosphatase 18 n=1 Tax=Aplysia californica TaxID=6500 RepID=A0ABM0JBU8_APLCA|nr:dual specificity protein phosphatase 18 [Aplysia californica]